MPQALRTITSVYDPIHNYFATNNSLAMIECENNLCTFTNYKKHIGSAVAFYERFAKGEFIRVFKMKIHVFFNTLAIAGCFLNIVFLNP